MFMPVFNDFNNLTSMKSFLAGFENVILTLILTIVHWAFKKIQTKLLYQDVLYLYNQISYFTI